MFIVIKDVDDNPACINTQDISIIHRSDDMDNEATYVIEYRNRNIEETIISEKVAIRLMKAITNVSFIKCFQYKWRNDVH
jgi:hypothetical protein